MKLAEFLSQTLAAGRSDDIHDSNDSTVSSDLPESTASSDSPLFIDSNNSTGFITDDRLLEMNFGDWELKNWNDISQPLLKKWMNDFVKAKAPGGESFIDLYNRTTEFMKELIDKNIEKDKTIVIITHGGVIRCIMSEILGFPLNNAFRLEIGFGSISKIKINRLENKNYIFSIRHINYRCN